MRTHNTLFVLSWVVSITAACTGEPEPSSGVLVTQGRAAVQDAFLPQVLQTEKKSGPGFARCTATLVAPRWVVTAAHCVTEPKLNGNTIAGIQNAVTPVPNATLAVMVDGEIAVLWKASPDDAERRVKATRTFIPRGYYERYEADGSLKTQPVPGDFDMAFLELAEAIDLPRYARPADVEVGAPLVMYGYGCDDSRPGDTAGMGTQQIGDTVAARVDGTTLTIGGRQDLARQCQGDSGGPTFKKGTEELQIVGVHSTKAADQTVNPEGYDVRLGAPEVRTFIAEVVPEIAAEDKTSQAAGPELR